MHQHMQPLNTSHIVACVEDACSILKPVSLPVPRQSLAKPASPIVTKLQTTRKTAGKRTVATSRATSTRTRGRVAKVASAQPVTPKSRKCTWSTIFQSSMVDKCSSSGIQSPSAITSLVVWSASKVRVRSGSDGFVA